MNASTSSLVRRVCKGGCGGFFTPPASRPGQEYIHGHKHGCATATLPKKAAAAPLGRNEDERRMLDYRLALATMRRETAEVVKEIDGVDDQIELLRVNLDDLDGRKELLTERHLNLTSTMMALEALSTGKSLVRQLQEGAGQ
ncbi:MAG TPA: hypothetical protein VGG26_08995 [Terracidiphilus sp.]|jgi:hypothetical protein